MNNAGYGLRGPLHSVSTEEIRAQFETNVFAALRLTRAVLPGMVERGKGTIVNVGSVVGRIGMPLSGALFREQVRAGGDERVDEDGALAAGGEGSDRGAGAIQDELPGEPGVVGTGRLGRPAPQRQGGARAGSARSMGAWEATPPRWPG